MTLASVQDALTRSQRILDRRIGEARAIAAQARAASLEAQELDERAACLEEAVGVLLSFADERAAEATAKVEGIVTTGLRQIFADDSLTFRAIQKQIGKRTDIAFEIESVIDGVTLATSVMDARGGGVASVAGFLLRVVILLLREDARKILFLDETFAQVSAEYEPALAEFLKELTQRTSIQIIMVTHSQAFSDFADKEYRVTQVGGRTQVSSTAVGTGT